MMDVPKMTARKILGTVAKTQRPFFDYRFEQYDITLLAVQEYDQFLDPSWIPPFETWRDFWSQNDEVSEFIEGIHGIDPDMLPPGYDTDPTVLEAFLVSQGINLDEVILRWDADELQYDGIGWELLSPYDSPIAAAHSILSDAHVELE